MTDNALTQIVTHDGSFHADDVLCHALLKQIAVGDFDFVRTRAPDLTAPKAGRLVFDVGGLYDPDRFVFDHHQADRPTRPDGVPYSAFGLLWCAFGDDYLESLDLDLSPEALTILLKEVDDGFVREIDLYDNGVGGPAPVGHISALTEAMVPTSPKATAADYDRLFADASLTIGYLFQLHVRKLASAWRSVARFREVADLATEQRVAILPEPLSWQKAALQAGGDDLAYVVFPKDQEGLWYCAAVPMAEGSFDLRVPLPARWAGLRDQALSEASGVEGAVFCHPSRFLCGASTREGAVALARQSLAFAESLGPSSSEGKALDRTVDQSADGDPA